MSITQRLARTAALHPWRIVACWGLVLAASAVAVVGLLGSALTSDAGRLPAGAKVSKADTGQIAALRSAAGSGFLLGDGTAREVELVPAQLAALAARAACRRRPGPRDGAQTGSIQARPLRV